MRHRVYAVDAAHSAARSRASSEAFEAFVAAAASQQAFAASLGRRRLKWWSFVGWRELMAADRHAEALCHAAALASRRSRLQGSLALWSRRADSATQLALLTERHLCHARLSGAMRSWRQATAATEAARLIYGRGRAGGLILMRSPFAHWRCTAPALAKLHSLSRRRRLRALAGALARWLAEAAFFRLGLEAMWSLPCRVLWHRFPLTRGQRVALDEALQHWAGRAATAQRAGFLRGAALRAWRRQGLARGWNTWTQHSVEQRLSSQTFRAAAVHMRGGRLFAALLFWRGDAAAASWAKRTARAAAAWREARLRAALDSMVEAWEEKRASEHRLAALARRANAHLARRLRERLSDALLGWFGLSSARASRREARRRASLASRKRRLASAWGGWADALAEVEAEWALVVAGRTRLASLCALYGLAEWRDAAAAHRATEELTSRARAWRRRRRTQAALDAWGNARARRLGLAVSATVGLCAVHARAWARWRGVVAQRALLCTLGASSRRLARRLQRRRGFLCWVGWTAVQLERRALDRESLGRLQPFFLPPLSLVAFVSPVRESKLIGMEREEPF